MKKIFSILLICLSINLFGQAPESFSYQAIIRNQNAILITEQTIGIRISILENSETGNPIYIETHVTNTNSNGLATLEIGTGSVIEGLFSAINWSTGSFFIKTEIDIEGGNNYSIEGVSKFHSVPYALYANNAANGLQNGTITNQIMYWDGNAWVNLNPGNNGQLLTMCNGQLKWTTNGLCEGTIESIECNSITVSGILEQYTSAQDVIVEIPYTGGDGELYPTNTFYSSEVPGFNATLVAGNFNLGNGSLYLTVTGASSEIGNAHFTITIGGQSCEIIIPVTPTLGSTGPLGIGSFYGGGRVGYILKPTDPGYVVGETHGLIISSANISTSAPWGCAGTIISGADGLALGSGGQNTLDIIAGCSNASSAAAICNNYVSEGFSDWHLPSSYELEKILLAGLSNGIMYGSSNQMFWTSTENGANTAIYYYYPPYSGTPTMIDVYFASKSTGARVRAVRYF